MIGEHVSVCRSDRHTCYVRKEIRSGPKTIYGQSAGAWLETGQRWVG